MKECQVNATMKDEENKTFKTKLLELVKRWRIMSLKKNRYKEARRSVMITNEHLIEQIERKKLMILKLKARLSEETRIVNFQNKT